MSKFIRVISLAVFALAVSGAAFGQSASFPVPGKPNPASSSVAVFYNIAKTNIVGGAELMPEKDYAFQPTKDVRTFAQLVAHIADAQYIFCSAVRQEANPNGANLQSGEVSQTLEQSGNKSKAQLVTALKEAFAYCDPAVAALSDTALGDAVKLNGADRPKSLPLVLTIAHLWEHYGNMVTYLRLRGIVPPSSARR